MRLADSRRKIKWADKHIADFERCIQRMPDCYTSTRDIDKNTGQKFIEFLPCKPLEVDEFPMLIGDAVHNLRTALDYAWERTINRVIPSVSKFSKFPIYPSLQELKAALESRKIHIASPLLYETVLRIEPYQGGDDAIWPIHKLDIADKHHLLIPVLREVAAVGIEVDDQDGFRQAGATGYVGNAERIVIPIPDHLDIKNDGHLTFQIVFDEGLPTKGLEVLETLQMFSRRVVQVVEILERFLETLPS